MFALLRLKGKEFTTAMLNKFLRNPFGGFVAIDFNYAIWIDAHKVLKINEIFLQYDDNS